MDPRDPRWKVGALKGSEHAKHTVSTCVQIIGTTFSASVRGLREALENGGFYESNKAVSEELSERLSKMEAEIHVLAKLGNKL